tara:strand:+ start:95 stop:439 length:345 start_codon:yes stop_codon:yes gene_type:complete
MENICIEIDDSSNKNFAFGTEDVPIPEQVNTFDSDSFIARQLDYQENYTMPELKRIADYYEISIRKMRKEEVIQELIIFESDPNNSVTYLKRLEAWYWLKELKKDSKLKQYILF